MTLCLHCKDTFKQLLWQRPISSFKTRLGSSLSVHTKKHHLFVWQDCVSVKDHDNRMAPWQNFMIYYVTLIWKKLCCISYCCVMRLFICHVYIWAMEFQGLIRRFFAFLLDGANERTIPERNYKKACTRVSDALKNKGGHAN